MGFFDGFKGFVRNDNKPTQASADTKATLSHKVLIVEDEKLLGDALEFKFNQAGFAVTRALNGQEGLEMAKSVNPDVILLDIMMPIMNGKTMLRALRQLPEFKTTPVIVLTNAGEVDNIKEMVDYNNAYDFLVKSNVTPDDILRKVQELLRGTNFH